MDIIFLFQDSVKTELLLTVRKEVRELKSQVAILKLHNSQLEAENRILRSAATAETLAKLEKCYFTDKPVIAQSVPS